MFTFKKSNSLIPHTKSKSRNVTQTHTTILSCAVYNVVIQYPVSSVDHKFKQSRDTFDKSCF